VPVVVENRAGAGGTVGLLAVARATPDGTTLGMTDSAFVVNPSIVKVLPYDTQKDFAPVVLVASSPQVLMVNPQVPARTVKELVELAKARPGQLSFATAGNGTAIHMAAEQLRLAAGIELLHVPYKGLGPAMTDAMGGQVTMVFGGPHTARQQVAGGKLRALAITGARRSAAMPDVMSFAEAGYPAVDMVTSNGIVAPAGTPPEIIQRINAAVNKALGASPELKQQFAGLGLDAVGGSPEQFRDWIGRELPKWARLVKQADIKAE
jgi:tripartite-type tricarboxylate transporter receptor subunit TctC